MDLPGATYRSSSGHESSSLAKSGYNPKDWDRFRGMGDGRIDFALNFGGTYLAPGFGSLSRITSS